MINIKGIDKARLLQALFNASFQQGLDKYGAKDMTLEDAQQIMEQKPQYFDYLRGRVMKVALLGDEMNEYLYDRDNGTGAAAEVVANLRIINAIPNS